MEKRSEWFFLTFVNRPIPFTYIPPTGNERGRKPIAMYVIAGHSRRWISKHTNSALWQECLKISFLFHHLWRPIPSRTVRSHRDSQLQVWSAWKIMKNRVGSTWFEIQAKSSLLGAEKLQGEHELSFRTSRRRFPRTENDDESSIAAYKLQLTPPVGTEAPPAGTEGFSSKLFNLASSSLGRFRRMNPRWKAWNPSKGTAPFLFRCRQGNER